MNKVLSLIFISLIHLISYGQNAAELDEQSKKLIEQRKFKEAVPILIKASELGSIESQYNLGYCYQTGSGIEKNTEKAIECYLKSADKGHNDSLYQLMMIYATGEIVEKDHALAFEYALKCAELDDSTCMLNVVNCYKDGLGVEKDTEKMLSWAIRLAKLQNPKNLTKSGRITSARLNLAYMYRDGINVTKNIDTSYAWFLIYNESKIDFSYLMQNSVIEEIKKLEELLTKNQINRGKKNAEKIFGQSLKNLDKIHTSEM